MSALHYDRPARSWLEALPLGNGTLGAMCWGGVQSVRFDLNDATAWSGGPQSEARQQAVGADAARDLLAEARALIDAGRPVDAERPLQRMQSAYTQAYLPLGSVELRFTPTPAMTTERSEDYGSIRYRRALDLAEATHEVSFVVDGAPVTQRTIVSAVHGVLVHVIDGMPALLRTDIVLTSPLRVLSRGEAEDESSLLLRLPADVAPGHENAYPPATWSEEPGSSLEAAIVARMVTGVAPDGRCRRVLFLASDTTFAGVGRLPEGSASDAAASARERVSSAVDEGVDALLDAHVADYRRLFDRVAFTIVPSGPATKKDLLPTDRRILEAAESQEGPLATDPELAALLFDYGRYLLISSSRPGGLPATLQGIWNDSMQPPWSSNYTTNINLQMNYWAADVANLAETADPLIDFIEALARAGTATAARLYGARGWVAHHNSDAWLYTSPVGGGHGSPAWAFWPMGGAWLVRHLWDRLAFGAGDDSFLRKRAWPVIRSQAEFLLDWMVRFNDGSWGTSPSTSPENEFVTPQGPAALGRSATMDIALIREVFETVILAAAQLGYADDDVTRRVRERLGLMPEGPARSIAGGVQEWLDDGMAVDPRHRHLSPLYALYPGAAPLDGAQLEDATVTLERRGDDSTGWSLVWKLALWARLDRPDKVSDVLRLFLRPAQDASGPFAGGLYPNLFAAHPPFQIDGNLGFVAALAESLLQSHGSSIDLLPALPVEIASGQISGLVARPGILVSLVWHDGDLVDVRLRARDAPATVTVRYRGRMLRCAVTTGSDTLLTSSQFVESDTAP